MRVFRTTYKARNGKTKEAQKGTSNSGITWIPSAVFPH